MLKVKRISIKGSVLGDVSLPKEMTADVNLPLLAQARRIYEDSAHVGISRAKTRAEVKRTGKKVYKQKGTGGARHGSKRAPIYVGGGVAHGPKGYGATLSFPGKMKEKARKSAISFKVEAKEAVVLDGVDKIGKTKSGASIFSKLEKETEAKRFTLVLSEKNMSVAKFFSNIKNVSVVSFTKLNAFQVLMGGYIVFDGDVFTKEKKVVKK